jgi:hypothetical protein
VIGVPGCSGAVLTLAIQLRSGVQRTVTEGVRRLVPQDPFYLQEVCAGLKFKEETRWHQLDNPFRGIHMANVTLKLVIGTFSAEVSGPAKYAEKKLEDLISKYLSSSMKPAFSESSGSSSSLLQGAAGKKKRSPSEVAKRAGNQTDRALLLGYYVEKVNGQSTFTTTELRDLGKEAKYSFTNISDSVASLVGRGLMMSAGDKEGHRAYTLTATGEEYAESLLSTP